MIRQFCAHRGAACRKVVAMAVAVLADAAAPIVHIRGNHEDCSRGGEGWFRLFAPRPPPQVDLLLGGHVHLAETIELANRATPQLVTCTLETSSLTCAEAPS